MGSALGMDRVSDSLSPSASALSPPPNENKHTFLSELNVLWVYYLIFLCEQEGPESYGGTGVASCSTDQGGLQFTHEHSVCDSFCCVIRGPRRLCVHPTRRQAAGGNGLGREGGPAGCRGRTCCVLREVHREQMASASSGVFFFNCRSWAAWIRGSMVWTAPLC